MSMQNYTGKDIKILSDIDAIRKYPGMYIGSTVDPNHLIIEVLNNSVDEVLMNYCNKIDIRFIDNKVIICDNGRGIPIDIHESGKLSCEIVFLKNHSGGKFNDIIYKKSGGLHGIGLVAVNALTEKLYVQIVRDNKVCRMYFTKGVLEKTELNDNTENYNYGTTIEITPDVSIFDNGFNKSYIYDRCKQLVALNKDLEIHYYDNSEYELIKSEKGLVDLINCKIISPLIKNNIEIINSENNIEYEVYFNWDNSSDEIIYSFTNCIIQVDHGSHVSGVKNGIIKFLCEQKDIADLSNKTHQLVWSDIRKGFRLAVHIRIQTPKFDSQSKTRLVSTDVKKEVENGVHKYLQVLHKNKSNVLNKIIDIAYQAMIIKTTKSNTDYDMNNLICDGYLTDCSTSNRNDAELFITEGESAGGTIKPVANRKTQAVLSLRGKILNIEKSNIKSLLDSKIIRVIIQAIGGKYNRLGEIEIEKMRYGKIIILVDADVDGSHIRSLLLTLFYRIIPDIIFQEKLHIVISPLFRIQTKDSSIYIKDNYELSNYLYNLIYKKYLNKFNDYSNHYDEIINYVISYIRSNNFNSEIIVLFIDCCISLNITNYNDVINKISDISNMLKQHSIYYDIYLSSNNSLCIENFMNLNKNVIDNNIFNENISNLLSEIIDKFNIKSIINCNNFFNKKYNKGVFASIYELINQIENEVTIQRFKGLGEMNPDQIKYTAVDPNTRIIKKIIISEAEKANEICEILMGINVEDRKKLILSIYDKYLIL